MSKASRRRDTYPARHSHREAAQARAEQLRPVIERLDPHGKRPASQVATELNTLGIARPSGREGLLWDANAVFRLEARLGVRSKRKYLGARLRDATYRQTPAERARVRQKDEARRDAERLRRKSGAAKAVYEATADLARRAAALRAERSGERT